MTAPPADTDVIYDNPLAGPDDVADWRMEGGGTVTFPLGRMRLESTVDPAQGQKANIAFWCPRRMPAHFRADWDWWGVREPGLCILFFCADGKDGKDLFDPSLPARTGPYDQYHHGEMNAYHISYFRRRLADEIRFHTCNLRKSYGFHLVAQGADPIPATPQQDPPYHLTLIKHGPEIRLSIDELEVLRYHDDQAHGPVLGEGYIGLRQMSPLIAE